MADVLAAMEAFGTHCRRGINFARETPVGDAATLPHDAARAFGRAALGGERLEDLVRFLAVACDFEAVLEARLECVASIAVEYGREALLHLHKGRCFGGGATCARASNSLIAFAPRIGACRSRIERVNTSNCFTLFASCCILSFCMLPNCVDRFLVLRRVDVRASWTTQHSPVLVHPGPGRSLFLAGPCKRRRSSSCAWRRCSRRTVTIFDSDATLRCSVLPQP